ncbi:MAG: SDR family NAD(P)-dependent oxidoreductase [Pirellulales bacterium]|nr:SDR family NAD(P)-dependent oxidoreductase [Pirellulales bacterium]
MPYWQKKIVLITGGSSGLGRAVAGMLSGHGARVVIAARNQERLSRVVDSLQALGGDVAGISTDLTQQKDVDQLFARVHDRYERLDAFFQCAGRSARAPVLETSSEDFMESMQVNFLAAVRCIPVAVPHLMPTGGHLVLVGSLASKAALPYHGGYPASKFALAAYAQQLRLFLRPKGIHVMLVCPGPIAPFEGDQHIVEKIGNIPEEALRPGGGAKLRAIDPNRLAARILTACVKRRPELVIPRRARLLFALSAIAPRFGDWLLQKSIHR